MLRGKKSRMGKNKGFMRKNNMNMCTLIQRTFMILNFKRIRKHKVFLMKGSGAI